MATVEELQALLSPQAPQQEAPQEPQVQPQTQPQTVDVGFLESLLPQEQPQPTGFNNINPTQQSRIDELRTGRETRSEKRRFKQLESGFAPSSIDSPSREELLLSQGLETQGPALRMARTRAGFTSNPVPAITQGLMSEFEGATPEQLNVRYEPLAKTKQLETQIDTALSNANQASEREIRERADDGEDVTQELRNKIIARNFQTNLTKMPGLELVFDDPKTGRTTVVNPIGADIGDVTELLGPALPFTGEVGGGTVGGIAGSTGGIPGTILGAAAGGGFGGGLGEAARLGVGRLIGAEPEEADFLDPVLSAGGSGAFNSALGGGINALVARSIAKRVASGQFGLESARFANFLDSPTFSKNSKAVERFNKLASERGVKGIAKPTVGQLSGSKQILDFERGLAGLDSPLTKIKAENAQLLDDVAGSFNPKTGAFNRETKDKLISRIASDIDKRIINKEKELGRKITESEAREVASQTKNILQSDFRTDNAFAADSLRQASQDAENTIFRERFGQQFADIEERAAGLTGSPEQVQRTAKEIQKEQSNEVFQLTNAEEQRFIDEAATAGIQPPNPQTDKQRLLGIQPKPDQSVVQFEGLSRGLSNLKEMKRKIDSGQLPDKNGRTAARLIAAGEQDLQQILTTAGRGDILEDLLTTRSNFGEAKKLSNKAFGKLLSKDRSGNFKVDDAQVFEQIVLNPSTAPAIKSMLIDSGQEGQIPLIRSGIRDVYAKRFLPEGAAPGQLKGAANQWFNQNERALKQFFSDAELKQFKNPVQVARKEAQNRKDLAKAQTNMRKWFGADLASTKNTPQEFMDKIFSKGTPERMRTLKGLLPDDQWNIFKDQYRSELLSKIRSGASEEGFNVNKLFSQTGDAANPSARESIGRATANQVLGKKDLKDLSDYGNVLQVLQQEGSKLVQDNTLDRSLKNIIRFFIKPLSPMSRKANALVNEGRNNINARMERALADPKKLKEMVTAVNKFRNKKVPQAAAISFVNLLGTDLNDQLDEINQEIEQE